MHRDARILGPLAVGALALLSPHRSTTAEEPAPTVGSQLQLCVACHGLDGRSLTSEWPSLAAQSESYLTEQLRLLREGQRYDDTMSPMAKELDDAMIRALAQHFAQLPMLGPTDAVRSATPDSPVATEASSLLYREGDPQRQLAPCGSCHGVDGRGVDAQPALRGQGAAYLKNQLDRYASGMRYVDKEGRKHVIATATAMEEVAAKLTDSERASLASFLQNMP